MNYRKAAQERKEQIEAEHKAEIEAATAALRARLESAAENLRTLTDTAIYKALPETSVIKQTIDALLAALTAADE